MQTHYLFAIGGGCGAVQCMSTLARGFDDAGETDCAHALRGRAFVRAYVRASTCASVRAYVRAS